MNAGVRDTDLPQAGYRVADGQGKQRTPARDMSLFIAPCEIFTSHPSHIAFVLSQSQREAPSSVE